MIEVYKHSEKAIIPTRAHLTDAGLDLYLLNDTFIPMLSTMTLGTGISLRVPDGNVGKIEDRSSLAASGLRTGGGVIDANYSGEIKVVMHNFSNNNSYHGGEYGKMLKAGEKIAQLLIYKVNTTGVMQTQFIWDSSRGSSGFGSTGA